MQKTQMLGLGTPYPKGWGSMGVRGKGRKGIGNVPKDKNGNSSPFGDETGKQRGGT